MAQLSRNAEVRGIIRPLSLKQKNSIKSYRGAGRKEARREVGGGGSAVEKGNFNVK